MTLSDRLRELINVLDITYAEFGQKVGADSASISKYISGKTKPSKGLLNSIMVVYNVNPKWLNGEDGPMFCNNISALQSKFIVELQELDDDQIRVLYDFMQYTIRVEEKLKAKYEQHDEP